MISATWMIDIDSNTEYLECRSESTYGIREAKIDIVKVYFQTKFDIHTVKSKQLEKPIAKAIFSDREKYGNILNGWIEEMPHTLFFQTKTDTPIYTEAIIKESHRE